MYPAATRLLTQVPLELTCKNSAHAVGWTTAFAGLALLLSVANFYFTRSDKSRDDIRRRRDEFWFQRVVYPNVIGPLITFYQEFAANYDWDNATDKYDLFRKLQGEISVKTKLIYGFPSEFKNLKVLARIEN